MKKVTFDLSKTVEGFRIRRASDHTTGVFFVLVVRPEFVNRVVAFVTNAYPQSSYKIEDAE